MLGIRISAAFQRSIRLDTDFDRPDALSSYVVQPSARGALYTVAKHIHDSAQRAFTWTGPYGGGKSSLALALAVLAGGSAATRKLARQALAIEADDNVHRVFCGRKPWIVIPVVGRRSDAIEVIGNAIDQYAPLPGRKPLKDGRRDVVAELVRRAEASDHGGVLLVLDELGKLLEGAAAAGSDIYFFQELAEAASRSDGRLVVVGVLHQAFEQYAAKLGRDVREEWAKIQGRYVDVPFVAGTDEVIELIGRAIDCTTSHPESAKLADRIGSVIRRRRPSSSAAISESLDRCFPLHPVTAALLGPISRRKFGQNERSVFGFLSSAEPLGFRDFLAGQSRTGDLGFYLPSRYWDYLRTNLEPAILASPDGHRWAIGAEAVERAQSKFHELHVSLVKTTALIDLFRDGSGLAAETTVLRDCVEGVSSADVEQALADLAKASILIYRKFQSSWGIFAGSDFDIDAAVNAARASSDETDTTRLKQLTNLAPVTARRHYADTGTLRWFDREILAAAHARQTVVKYDLSPGTGRFVLLLQSPDFPEQKALRLATELSQESQQEMILYGVPRGQLTILEQAADLASLEAVSRNRPELEGDAVARREVEARLRQLRSDLESALRDAFVNARWHYKGERFDVNPSEGLSPLASLVCRKAFSKAPRIHSELVNRNTLSTSAAKAQRLLLHRMLTYATRPNLGYEGYPADAGLYYTIISELGIHQASGNEAAFTPPEKSLEAGSKCLVPLWEATRKLLEGRENGLTLADLYRVWQAPPFGLKEGVLPILALGYLLTFRSEIALYVDGMFTPELTEAGVDEWLQDPNRIAWKAVRIDANAKDLLKAIAKKMAQVLKRPVSPDPLDSARALVSFAVNLPPWTQRTGHLTDRTRNVRTLLLKASDPVKVIFTDLPETLDARDANSLVSAIGAVVSELDSAYGLALGRIREKLFASLDHSSDIASLQARARVVQGISGDFRLDAFAGRLSSFVDQPTDLEGLVSLTVSKPPQSFTDHDFDQAIAQLTKWGFEFRRIEALASLQGRSSTRRALAVVFGGGRTVSGSFDIAESDGAEARLLAEKMLGDVRSGKVKEGVFLAAVIDAGLKLLEEKEDGVS